ncbi:flagellar hook-length control protein FliK [Luteimonas sp. S4-F44]|uniref:flagellar hook-length control protein FliK n=1 Tax=Luteimonas sp. S4-F44 TaxID=2925842 RepID=UPI001F52C536|nr:flagellar hook-length control protein FliK [Luteimonas sp. S4-F44]UNK43958.1 flagellar hook-length control protein FliK [Luteimonas sp. S4-F44]
MTPLAATATTGIGATSAAARGPGAATGAASGEDGFARALERRQAQRSADASAQRRAPQARSDDRPSEEVDATASSDTVPAPEDRDPAAAIGTEPVPTDPMPWPPAGLAALPGLAAVPLAEPPAETAAAPEALTPQPASSSTAATTLVPPPTSARALSPDAASGDQGALAAIAAADLAAATASGEPAADTRETPTPIAFALPGAPAPVMRAPPPLLDAPLPTPDVQGGDFEAQLGAQLEWMAGQKIGHARIRVTPQDLGPIEVRLQLDGDRIAADFISPHAQTRDALEQGLPRLRDLLGEHGFQLAHAGVGHDGGSDARDGMSSPAGYPASETSQGAGADALPAPTPTARRIGLLDAYA